MCLFGFCIEAGGRLVWVFFLLPVFCIVLEGRKNKKKRKRLALKKWCFALVGVGWFGRFGLDLLKKLAEIFFLVFVF
jgi:hypothetical protein